MKIHVLIRIVALLAVGLTAGWFWGCAENAGASTNPPKLLVVGGDTVNWGEVGGGELKRSLKIVNIGGDTLKIADVKPSCGCTTAPLDKNTLLPGDTATINLTMNVAGKHGETMKTLRISTNDSTSLIRTVYLKANIIQDVLAEPAYFHIDNVEPGQEGSNTIMLKNVGKEAVTIQPPKELDAALTAIRFSMLKPATLNPGDSLAVTVYATPLNNGITSSNYVFATNSKLTPEVKTPLTISVKSGSPTAVIETPGSPRKGQ